MIHLRAAIKAAIYGDIRYYILRDSILGCHFLYIQRVWKSVEVIRTLI